MAALTLAGCGGSDLKTYKADSPAMSPAIKLGSSFVEDPGAYRNAGPKVGDIVVFHPPTAPQGYPTCADPHQGLSSQSVCSVAASQESSELIVKRVVAVPGDRISIVNGRLIRNGKPETGYQVTPCSNTAACDLPRQVVIPPGDYFMLGDNRGVSSDSRFFGPVPRSWIVGKVLGH
ncbi:MAG: signal peptidase I [Solirubrobacteraceae bacterium]